MPNDYNNTRTVPQLIFAADASGGGGGNSVAGDSSTVTVASFTQLARISHFHRLAMATAALEFSRRNFLDELAETIYPMEGSILQPNGSAFAVPDTLIDDVFPDADARWLSDFKRFAVEPPRQKPQSKVLPRLQIIDLYFRIKHPERARLIVL